MMGITCVIMGGNFYVFMVPTGIGQPGKMGRHFPVREKSGDFVKTGKVREIYSKYWKTLKKLYWKIEKKYWKSQRSLSASNNESLQIWYHQAVN